MITGQYKIADHAFAVQSDYDYVHTLMADYATDEPPQFTVTVTQEQRDAERREWERYAPAEDKPLNVSEGYLETINVHRQFAAWALKDDYLLIHGSAIAVDGTAYLFTARSGTGKSTHTRLWREHFGDRAEMVNDDKPFLKITPSGTTAYGTPWNGKHRLGENIARPLRAICLLERAEENHIERVDKKDAFAALYPAVYRDPDPKMLRRVLALMDILTTTVPIYRLGCNMNPDAALVSYTGMAGKE